MKVVWISAGVSSFMAGVLGGAEKWIYIDVTDQHPDSMRFIKDCERAVDVKIEILNLYLLQEISHLLKSVVIAEIDINLVLVKYILVYLVV